MESNIYIIGIWLVSIFVGSIAIVIYLGSKKLSSRVFTLCITLDMLWMITEGLIISASDSDKAIIYVRIAYFIGTLIAAGFLLFFLTFPEDKRLSYKVVFSLVLIESIFFYIFVLSDAVIHDIFPIKEISPWGWNFGPLSFLLELFFFGSFVIGLRRLYKKYRAESTNQTKVNLAYMLIAITSGIIPPGIFSMIFFRLGIFGYNWLGPFSQIIWIPIIAYSIIRYRQMDVRAVATEVLALAMAVIFFVNIFVDLPVGIWDNVIEFLVFLMLAIYLIRSALREAKQRAELKDLNENLETRVAEQTVQIRSAYESEKQARIDLEKLNDAKNQFVMMTQHNMRMPISNVNLSIESALKDSSLTTDRREELESAMASGKRLNRIVDDFLDITTIKPGANILSIEKASLRDTVRDLVIESRAALSDMNINLEWPDNTESWPVMPMDIGKMGEALAILFENAIRYNKKCGSITIHTKKNPNSFRIGIYNTGIGISNEEIAKIGSSLFYRSEFARKNYPIGMGVGLSVAKAIVAAHHGSLSIESEGLGKGAKVSIELPAVNKS